VGRPEGKRHLEDLGEDGSLLLKWIFMKFHGSIGWTYLAQDRDRW